MQVPKGKGTIEKRCLSRGASLVSLCKSERQERQPILWLVPRHSNAIQVNSPLAAAIQHDQDRRLAGLLHYGPQFAGKLVFIGNDVPGGVAWRQDSDSGSGGYGLCHGSGCVVSWAAGRGRHFERALTKAPLLGRELRGCSLLTRLEKPATSRKPKNPPLPGALTATTH